MRLDKWEWTIKTMNTVDHKTLTHHQITRIIPVPSVILRIMKKKKDAVNHLESCKNLQTLGALSPPVLFARSGPPQVKI